MIELVENGMQGHTMTASLLTLLYVEKGLTLKQVGDHLGCSQQTVLNHMVRFGISRRPLGAHCKGKPSHRRGKRGVFSVETRQKMRMSTLRLNAMGQCLPPAPKSGAAHWNWQGGIAYQHDRGKYKRRLRAWRVAVYQRDSFTCQVCAQVGGKLNAHHIQPWSRFPDLRFVLDNGVALCVECHKLTHQAKKGVSHE